MLGGSPSFWVAASITRTASPSEARGARLKDRVTAGNCPCRAMASGAVVSTAWVTAVSGTTAVAGATLVAGAVGGAVAAVLLAMPVPAGPALVELLPVPARRCRGGRPDSSGRQAAPRGRPGTG